MVFDLHSKKNIIIVVIFLILVGAGAAWFFLYHRPHDVLPVTQMSGEVAQIESPDDIRIKHMKLIEKSVLALLQRGDKLPLPQKAFGFRLKEVKIGYQGIAGSDFYDAIGLTNLLDPVTELPYNYYVSDDRTEYKIFSYLKDETNRNGTVGDKSVFSVGTFSGDFLLSVSGDVLSSPGTKVDLLDNVSRKQAGLDTLGSCQDILKTIQLYTRPRSGIYSVYISGRETKVYCDMQTDGGGWTLFYANNGHEASPVDKSYVQMRDTMSIDPIFDFSNYDDPNLMGLLDYSSFIDGGAKEVLIKNRTGELRRWIKFIFSTSRTLDWALGPKVLGKTDLGCFELPRRSTWTIVNNDKTIYLEDLKYMMNNLGTSWGVSHEKIFCNGFEKSFKPLIAFYNANYKTYDGRARGTEGLGGKWGPDNEYRYFIR